jgi:hypothetical protein
MYGLKFGQNGHFSQKNQPKKPLSLMPCTFSQSEHHFGQCKHFIQIESFERL